jgi:hypothetical protein
MNLAVERHEKGCVRQKYLARGFSPSVKIKRCGPGLLLERLQKYRIKYRKTILRYVPGTTPARPLEEKVDKYIITCSRW